MRLRRSLRSFPEGTRCVRQYGARRPGPETSRHTHANRSHRDTRSRFTKASRACPGSIGSQPRSASVATRIASCAGSPRAGCIEGAPTSPDETSVSARSRLSEVVGATVSFGLASDGIRGAPAITRPNAVIRPMICSAPCPTGSWNTRIPPLIAMRLAAIEVNAITSNVGPSCKLRAEAERATTGRPPRPRSVGSVASAPATCRRP
jgi:hypothetical protein